MLVVPKSLNIKLRKDLNHLNKEYFESLWVECNLTNDAANKCKQLINISYNPKQAGTGPSRRHIQGSKIAKRLPSVKYSFTEVENRKFFENFFLKKLHTKKIGPSGALTSHNAEKLKGGTL